MWPSSEKLKNCLGKSGWHKERWLGINDSLYNVLATNFGQRALSKSNDPIIRDQGQASIRKTSTQSARKSLFKGQN